MSITLDRPPLDEQRHAWAQWFHKLYLKIGELFNEDKIALLGSKTLIDMQTAGNTTIFTTLKNKKTRISHIAIRNPSASMAGGTDFSFTSWRQTVDLSSLTTPDTDYIVLDGNNAKYTEIDGGTAFQITVTTGTAAPCTATVDVFGYVT